MPLRVKLGPLYSQGWESQKRVYLHKEPPGQNHWPYPVHLIPARLQGSSWSSLGRQKCWTSRLPSLLPQPGRYPHPRSGPVAEEGSRRCNASRELAASSSHGDLSFAVGAQVPGSAAGAAVKARGLRAEGLGQLLHTELAPGRVAWPSGRGRGVNHQVAAGCGPDGAAGGPGLVVARWGGTGGGRVARGGPGAGVEQLRQVLGGPPGSRREGQRGGFRGRKTLVEVRSGGLCGDREP